MPINQPNGGARFPPSKVLYRDWGTETILEENEHYTLKEISMDGMKPGGLQFHHKKWESGVVI